MGAIGGVLPHDEVTGDILTRPRKREEHVVVGPFVRVGR
jgi:hypothetical protein